MSQWTGFRRATDLWWSPVAAKMIKLIWYCFTSYNIQLTLLAPLHSFPKTFPGCLSRKHIGKRKHDCSRRWSNKSSWVDYCLQEQCACCVLTKQPLPWLSCQIQHGDDAISCSLHMIASPAYSSSVVCPPHTYTGTHALTHLSLLSCDVTRAAELIPTHSLAILPWKGKRRSVWEVVVVAMGDLLLSLHYSHLPVALVVCRIWQWPSSLYRIRWGKHHPLDTLKKKCFSSHRELVLTWRLNVCECAVHGFRSKLVLWISKRT